ncbi:MAG TPA: MFS transporter [Ktedonobacterales bacterium]|nr:MFS transporter [Ktedonobacterales bacterium]
MTSVSMPVPPKRKRLGADFWKFWTGQTISNLGSSITLFALPLIVFNLTHSALNLGISAAADMLPYPLFGLLLGAMTDRVNRKHMMILTDIGRAAVVGSIPLAFTLGIGSVWWIYGVGFLQSTLTICFESGQFAAIPSLVGRDDIVTANGRIQASYSGASVLGPFLAGLLVALLPVTNLMIFDAASFLISSFSLSLVRISFNSDDGERERKNIFRDVVEGLRYVIKHPVLRNISMMMCLVNFIAVTAGAQLVLFAHNQLNASKQQIAWLFTASALGVVVLALLAGPLRKRWSFSRVALGALMTEGLLQAIFSQLHWYWLALPIWGIAGGCGILFNINTGSLRQTIVPSHLLGRVLSIASVLAWSAIPLGALLGGYLIQATHNVALVYFAIGTLTFLVPLIFSFTALGHADRYLPKKDEQAPAGAETQESPVVV